MAFVYTRADLKSRVNANIHGKIGMLVDDEATLNDAVREYLKIDPRSTRRKSALTPNLYNGVYEYAVASDLDGYKLIDIPAQAKREDGQFFLIPSEEFDRVHPKGAIAIDDYNNTRILKINSRVDSKLLVISELDSITSGGGTWSAFGGVTTVETDTDDFVHGAGSVSFDINATSATTAGIVNTAINSINLTDYLGGNGSVFVYARINSTTNLTNYILRIGSSSSAYYSKTVTARHDGTAFVAGWNLLRFDLSSLTATGVPTDTAIRYIALYMTKTTGKISESDYKFDYLTLMKGKFHDVKYYSKYGWTSSAGAYKENSTDDSDLLVADTDEYNLIIEKASQVAADEVDEDATATKYEARYKEHVKQYQQRNPSEAKVMTNEYYGYGTSDAGYSSS